MAAIPHALRDSQIAVSPDLDQGAARSTALMFDLFCIADHRVAALGNGFVWIILDPQEASLHNIAHFINR